MPASSALGVGAGLRTLRDADSGTDQRTSASFGDDDSRQPAVPRQLRLDNRGIGIHTCGRWHHLLTAEVEIAMQEAGLTTPVTAVWPVAGEEVACACSTPTMRCDCEYGRLTNDGTRRGGAMIRSRR